MSATLAKVIFMLMIASPAQERDADVLLDSIRTFGGSCSSVPIYLVNALPGSGRLNASLQNKATRVIQLKMDERYRSFPFADKVYACAQVEELVKKEADWLVWFNPEMIVIAEPSQLVGSAGSAAVLRPVHIANVGVLTGQPVGRFWQGVYAAARIDPKQAWSVESYVDGQSLLAYYNSGFMGYRPSRGVFRAWKETFETILGDAASLAEMCPDDQHRFFLHQAVLSAVTVEKLHRDEILVLPESYGYPLHLHSSLAEDRRVKNLSEVVTLIHDGQLEELLKGIEIEPRLRSWLLEHGINHE